MGLWEAATRVTDWPTLLNLLRQELGWPLPDSFSWDCTFAWSDDDLQLAPLQASRLEGGQVHQLRPFCPEQPWGIFWVESRRESLGNQGRSRSHLARSTGARIPQEESPVPARP